MLTRKKPGRATLALCVVLWSPLPLLATPESEALTRRGLDHLEATRYRDAIESFNAAVRSDPKDLRPVFFQGVALNRLGAYGQALALLARVEKLGLQHTDLDFEIGWSLMGLRQPRACVQRLERFERSSPGRAQASEFLGRCHLMLGDYDRAEAAFDEAVKRDPRLKGTVDLSMAALEQARKRPQAMRDRLNSAAQSDTQTGRALRELLAPPPAPPAALVPKPFRFGVAFSAGYNDNVIGLGSTIPLPTDISSKAAWFARTNLTGSYSYALTDRTAATLGAAILFDRYDRLHAADLNDMFVYGDLVHRVSDGLGFSFRLSDEYTVLGGRRFRNLLTLRPAVSFRLTERSVTEFAFAHAKNDYVGNVPIVFSRDGDSSAATVTHLFQVPNTKWSGALSASYTQYRAEGNDFTFDAYGATGSVRYDFTERLSGVVGFGYTGYDYANPNSLSPPAGFAFARDDNQTLVFVQLVGPLAGGWRWFIQGQKVRNRSNIVFYDYRQGTASAGVAADF